MAKDALCFLCGGLPMPASVCVLLRIDSFEVFCVPPTVRAKSMPLTLLSSPT